MNNKTLVAVIRNNRNDVELLARNRQEIMDALDILRLDTGDVITLTMRYVDNRELATIPEQNEALYLAVQNEGYPQLLGA